MKNTKNQNRVTKNNVKNLKKALIPFGIFVLFVISLLVYNWYSEYRVDMQEKERLMTLVEKLEAVKNKMHETKLVSFSHNYNVGKACARPVLFDDWNCGTTLTMRVTSKKSNYEIITTLDKNITRDGYFKRLNESFKEPLPGALYATSTKPEMICKTEFYEDDLMKLKQSIRMQCWTESKKSWYKNTEPFTNGAFGSDAWRE
jgi:hypothetical protein